jgi:enoyl-CoA hydratase/carnithine racemase
MAYDDLQVDIRDGVAVLTLDRPAHMNAFSGAMATSLAAGGAARLAGRRVVPQRAACPRRRHPLTSALL